MASKEEGGHTAFPAVLYTEPSSLGLLANVLCAFILALQNFTLTLDAAPASFIISGLHLILVGGLVQAIAGFLSFRKNDHLGGSAFIIFASLWTSQGIFSILLPRYGETELFKESVLSGLVPFCVMAVILFFASLTVNYIMPPVLVAMFASLVFECVGLYFSWALYVAGVFEIVIVGFGVYGACASMLRGISQRYVWPGFGNAPVNVLLIKTKTQPRRKNETKKNTKYAEPMALGYLSNLVPASIIAFYCFGYSQAFQINSVWAIPVLLGQIFASFYSFLRKDLYHSFVFVLYTAIWAGKMGTEFLFTQKPTFTGEYERAPALFGIWMVFVLLLTVTVVSLSINVVSFCVNLSFILMLGLGYEFIPQPIYYYTLGASNCLIFLVSAYAGLSSLVNSIAEKPVIPVGWEIISVEKLSRGFIKMRCSNSAKLRPLGSTTHSEIAQLMSLSAMAVSSMYGATVDLTSGYAALPWIIGSGVLLQLLAVRCFYASGAMAKTFLSLIYATFWLAWGAIIVSDIRPSSLMMTSIILVTLSATGCLVSLAFTKTWFIFSLLMTLNTITLLLRETGAYPQYLSIGFMIATSLVAFYGSIALFLNATFFLEVLPMGKPLFNLKEKINASKRAEFRNSPACPLYNSCLTSGLHSLAGILDEGGVCGIPTDTVYALAASCKHPTSIERLYKVKERPAEKPICLCLSSLDQLRSSNPEFSPLLWRFMNNCYPGGISCVVPKGEWLKRLGVGEASSFVGTPQSVCIRVPDSTVLSHLVTLTGPIAITSANPSGAPDSTHHDMVLETLGHKIDGLLCDGLSNHSVASTVVNCMKIDEGVITYFRIGAVPKAIVDNIFEETKKTMFADIAA